MSQKFKRRNYFVKKDLQGKMILGFFLFVFGSVVLFAVILGMMSADTMTISYQNNNLEFGQTPMVLLKNALAANWLFLVFGGALLVVAALLISHRIAGPLFRFEMTLEYMREGNLNNTIHLRNHDEGVDLADHINAFNRQLSDKIREINKHAQSIDELLGKMDQADSSTLDKDSFLERSKSIRTYNNAIRKVTDSFTLTDE